MTKVIFVDRPALLDIHLEAARDMHPDCAFYDDIPEEAEFVARAQSAEVLVVSHTARLCTRPVLEALPALRAVIVVGVDAAGLDLKACERSLIEVHTFPDATIRSSAEVAFMSALMLAHRSHSAWRHVLTNQTRHDDFFEGWELFDKVLGVIGAGGLGTRLIQIGQGFGMEVISHTRTPSTPRARQLGIDRFYDLNTVLSDSDVVMAAVPANVNGDPLIGQRQIARMSPDCIFINAGSANSVDLDALMAAVQERRIAGAAMDVVPYFTNDNRRNILIQEFMRSPQVLTLPKTSFQSYETKARMGEGVVEILRSYAN